MLRNLKEAEKPADLQILVVAATSQKYADNLDKELSKIAPTRVVRIDQQAIDHDRLRQENVLDNWRTSQVNMQKIHNVYETYATVVKHSDPTADEYWFVEDDTLFPLNAYPRMKQVMDILQADIVSGISYFWHGGKASPRNFWNLNYDNVFGNHDTSGEMHFKLTPMEEQEKGVSRLGATGLGGLLCKREAVRTWQPQYYEYLGSGADISFFQNAQVKGLQAYGMWDLYLPHITKYENGDIAILGRIDKSLLKLIN